ncbi:MAG: DUF1275 domain-containing protein [Ruminococcus sp.]|nr:DUF1275 domain-containing protein [Ruminococcus sp.]
MTNTKRQMSDTYLVAAILASAGGFLDAYSYLVRGNVFANAHTANIVLLGMSFFERDWLSCGKYLAPIVMFIAGVLVADRIRSRLSASRFHWRQYVILLEAAVLVVASFIPHGNWDIVANVLISFVCSLQVESFRKVHSIPFSTTLCTGNLRTATESLSHYMTHKDEESLSVAFKLFGIVLFFTMGVIFGTLISAASGRAALAFAIIELIAVFVLMLIDNEKGEAKTEEQTEAKTEEQ